MTLASIELEPSPSEKRSVTSTATVLIFGLAGFLAAGLLFLLEPLAAKALLPELGGSPSVWNTAMAFFQLTLLAGYLVAHLVATRVPTRWRRPLQLALVAAPLLLLPFELPDGFEAGGSPLWWELTALGVMVGAPFFALATISPTVQKWFASTRHRRASDPFFLYAASNLGSFLGLFAYPLVVEPQLDLVDQARWFTWAYITFVVVMLAAGLVRQRSVEEVDPTLSTEAVTFKRRAYWVAASAVPALLLMGVTRHLATDVASFPLLWVVPLAIYLATFVIAFSRFSTPITQVAADRLPLVAVAAAVASAGVTGSLWIGAMIPLLLLAMAGLAAHGSVYNDRPDQAQLTQFYLWVSAGGAIGGLLGALVAPVVFSRILEYPIAVVAAVLLCPVAPRFPARLRRIAFILYLGGVAGALGPDQFRLATFSLAVAAVAAVVAGHTRAMVGLLVAGLFVTAVAWDRDDLLLERRTFFGVYQVLATDTIHTLVSGTTVHGQQRFDPAPGYDPLSYYHRDGPFGQVMAAYAGKGDRVGVIGLGAGALAAYGRPGQSFVFYEIDPAVVAIARDPNLFTYLRDSEAEVETVVGDGRLMLEGADRPFDLLVVDAFSSDSIPTHLVTIQALSLYLDRVTTEGVVALHISNRHLDLEPVIGRLAQEMGLTARVRYFNPTTGNSEAASTTVLVLARHPDDLGELASDPEWKVPRAGQQLWTDTYTDLVSVIRWR